MSIINTDRQIVAESGSYQVRKIVRYSEFAGRSVFSVFEFKPSGASLYTYPDGAPRASIEVEVYHPCVKFGSLWSSEVSWPSTSDRRPALARALAVALDLAAEEAARLDEQRGL